MREIVWLSPTGDLIIVTKSYWDSLWKIDYDIPIPSLGFEAYVALGGYCTDFLCKCGFIKLGDL